MTYLFLNISKNKPVVFVNITLSKKAKIFHKFIRLINKNHEYNYYTKEDDKFTYIFINCNKYKNILSKQKIHDAMINQKKFNI
jgi:hypothetical protein